jgi:large subunit ribosomal protein L31
MSSWRRSRTELGPRGSSRGRARGLAPRGGGPRDGDVVLCGDVLRHWSRDEYRLALRRLRPAIDRGPGRGQRAEGGSRRPSSSARSRTAQRRSWRSRRLGVDRNLRRAGRALRLPRALLAGAPRGAEPRRRLSTCWPCLFGASVEFLRAAGRLTVWVPAALGVRVQPRRPYSRGGTDLTRQPTLFQATVRCSSCGTTFETSSTRAEIVVDVCSSCHPAYTGRERTTASSDRVQRFNRRRALARQAA